MRKIFFLPILFLLVGCGQSDEEKQNIATVTCNIIAETKKDPAMKIKEMNVARENLSEAIIINNYKKVFDEY